MENKNKLRTGGTARLIITLSSSLLLALAVFFFENIFGGAPFGDQGTTTTAFLTAHPAMIIWLFMGIVQILFCLCMLPYMWAQIKGLHARLLVSRNDISVHWALVVVFALSTLVVAKLAVNPHIGKVLEEGGLMAHATLKFGTIVTLSYIVLCACVYQLLIIYSLSFTYPSPDYFVYMGMKEKSVGILYIIGFVITASTVATALLQNVTGKDARFPQQMVYAYGLFNSLYIAVVYLPISERIRSWGSSIVDDQLKNLGTSEMIGPENFKKNRDALRSIYQLDEDYAGLVKKAVPILAPLLTSLMSYAGLK